MNMPRFPRCGYYSMFPVTSAFADGIDTSEVADILADGGNWAVCDAIIVTQNLERVQTMTMNMPRFPRCGYYSMFPIASAFADGIDTSEVADILADGGNWAVCDAIIMAQDLGISAAQGVDLGAMIESLERAERAD
jgi:hypothetical protein